MARPITVPGRKPHRATGKPRGGARPGAGRPFGSRNILPKGAVKALQACRLRVPKGTPEDLAELADRSLERVADVMEERVHSSVAASVLKAATVIREEVCGPIVKKVEIEGKIGIAAILDQMDALPEAGDTAALAAEAVAVDEVTDAEIVDEPVKPKGPIIRRKGVIVQ